MALFINENCINCRICQAHCPTKAIRYGGNYKYEINPEKCVECKTCVKYCNMGAISTEPNSPESEPVAPHPPMELDCDVAVVGGGGAGLVAAVRTAQLSGKKVMVLEKFKNPGGRAWYAVGLRVASSRMEREAGVPDNRLEMKRRVMDDTYHTLNPRMVNNTIDGLGTFFDWLWDLGGAEGKFELMEPQHGAMTQLQLGSSRKLVNFVERPPGACGGTGRYIIDKMLEYCDKLGVDILTEHRVTEMITKDGKVSAIVAQDPGGITKINCKACIIATGSWICSKEIAEKYMPDFAQADIAQTGHVIKHLTGDGQRLGEMAGAFVDYENLAVSLYGPTPNPMIPALIAHGETPYGLSVNYNGERWGDEGVAIRTVMQLIKQPRGHAFKVIDSNMFESINADWLANGRYTGNEEQLTEAMVADIDRLMTLEDKPIMRAASLDELAVQMGVDPDALSKSVARYNEICLNGEDTDFFKEPEYLIPVVKPPFYAVRCYTHTDGGAGGILINENMEACKKNGDVIDGLYAAGDVTSGNYILNNSSRKKSIINDLTWAVVSGFMSAENISEYINAD